MDFGLVAVILIGAFVIASQMSEDDNDDNDKGGLQPVYARR